MIFILQCMVLELRMEYFGEYFRIHLRNIKRLLSLSAKPTFKIIHLGWLRFLRIDFLKINKYLRQKMLKYSAVNLLD